MPNASKLEMIKKLIVPPPPWAPPFATKSHYRCRRILTQFDLCRIVLCGVSILWEASKCKEYPPDFSPVLSWFLTCKICAPVEDYQPRTHPAIDSRRNVLCWVGVCEIRCWKTLKLRNNVFVVNPRPMQLNSLSLLRDRGPRLGIYKQLLRQVLSTFHIIST